MKEQFRKLTENFLSLSVLQGSRYVLPLITVPYLVRVIGPEKFGLISFAQAFMMYFIVFTDYGFFLSATKRVAIYRENRKCLSEIFSSVVAIELGLIVLSFLLLALIVACVPRLSRDWQLYLWTFGVVPGNAFSLIWFFQGMEKMKFIAIINLFSKLLFVVLMFVFVKSPSDYLSVAVLNSLGYLVAGILSLIIAVRRFKIDIIIPSVTLIKKEFAEGYHVFIFSLSSSVYTFSSAFILGILTNNSIVGYYCAGEKIIKAVQALFSPISQAIFPHLSQLAKTSKIEALKFAGKVALNSAAALFCISLLIFIFAEKIVVVVLGNQYMPTVPIIRILAFLPLIANMGNIFGTQILVNFDLAYLSSRVAVVAGMLNVPLVIIMVMVYKGSGAALAMLVTEIFMAFTCLVIIEKKGLSLLGQIPRNRVK